MKTERMVLLVTPEEKAAIAAKAERLGISTSAFVRRAVDLIDADDLLAMEELAALAPQLTALANRLERDRDQAAEQARVREERAAYYRSDAYRDEVRREVLNDESIDWPAVRAMFGFAGAGSDRAA